MKKIGSFIGVIVIIFIFGSALCACTDPNAKNEIKIENADWKLQVAMRVDVENQDSEVIARNNAWNLEDTTVPVVDVNLVAQNGMITITDLSDTTTSFNGAYQKADTINLETVIYTVTVGNLMGNANVSFTKDNKGAKQRTLILTLLKDDIQYTLHFISVK